MTVDRLSELRSVARAQALESFDYFANHVLGHKLPSEVCDALQKELERGNEVHLEPFTRPIINAWLCVLGKQPKLLKAPNATFAWLFNDFVEDRAA